MTDEIKPTTIGRIGRTKRNKPTFVIPGLARPLMWYGQSPPVGSELTIVEFLGWIDTNQILLSERQLIDPTYPLSENQKSRHRAKEIRRRKQVVLTNRQDQAPLTSQEQFDIYGPPTDKQVAQLAKLNYDGPPPRTTIDARALIGRLLNLHSGT